VQEEEFTFLQSNNKGGFSILSDIPRSRYDGVFFREGNQVYKILESINGEGEILNLHNHFSHIVRETPNQVKETIFMPNGKNSLVYMNNKQSDVLLTLDAKKIYSNEEWGREYSVSKEKKCLVITFNQAQEDDYQVYLAIHGKNIKYQPLEEWEEHYYERDQQRNSWPWSRWGIHSSNSGASTITIFRR
jgi:hypothetical protein